MTDAFRPISTRLAALAAVATLAVMSLAFSSLRAQEARRVPPPALDELATGASREVAVLAGGCFWGVQGVFQHVDGVASAVSGYAGGAAATAHYDMTSEGNTGHAESVKVTFDPNRISYGKLLQIYVSVAHDPTELNRQGPDEGTQYRSAIFPTSEGQAKVAEAYIAQLNAAHAFAAPVVTTIEPGKTFYPAEAYHQDFLVRNPTYPYIVFNDLPKVEALKRLFPEVYRATPALVGAKS
ncbi:peptide-methionine (S)-S-oxide reductase [Roseiarcus fermentans]|uniref:Peptide methionine sulfoxide reductase MsrA n=1 Tax=Roseiarcus fermentans TaxID=1473586 RepID=A0A366EET6_9HYPH|nr:peptide-methionine (S)-S-oxide reductase MsrA [Roseiarcus fermentans]RBP00240.1 peptide-methionine (S)-S-oxide reductase [Roseiarcus fermentans]